MAKPEGKEKNVYSYMRWSSEPQSWGDSERRQEQMAQDWCQRNGRTLVDQTFADRGVSGWRGDNRREGALGALLKIVKAGDTILIEDCDRWSRESPLDSMNALRDTVNRGVEIVFLKTGIVVNSSNFNDPGVLFPNFFGSFVANAAQCETGLVAEYLAVLSVKSLTQHRRIGDAAGVVAVGLHGIHDEPSWNCGKFRGWQASR